MTISEREKRKGDEDRPFVALKRTVLNVRTYVHENMVPPLVRLEASLDVASKLGKKVAAAREASRKSLKKGFVKFAARIEPSESVGTRTQVVKLNAFMSI